MICSKILQKLPKKYRQDSMSKKHPSSWKREGMIKVKDISSIPLESNFQIPERQKLLSLKVSNSSSLVG